MASSQRGVHERQSRLKKNICKIVAIVATSMYNVRFVSIFRNDVVILAILICF